MTILVTLLFFNGIINKNLQSINSGKKNADGKRKSSYFCSCTGTTNFVQIILVLSSNSKQTLLELLSTINVQCNIRKRLGVNLDHDFLSTALVVHCKKMCHFSGSLDLFKLPLNGSLTPD